MDTKTPSLDDQIFQKKVVSFQKDLAMLEEKHGVKIVPMIQSSRHGIIPMLEFANKKQYESHVAKMMG